MKYTILHEDPEQDIVQRLLHIRGLGDDDLQNFLDPTRQVYRQDPKTLHDIDLASHRITQAMDCNEKIFIFGDYDVDGIVSSFVMKSFFDIVWYHDIHTMLPHRVDDGYGIKDYLIDRMHAQGAQLIITVDNGITSVAEVEHAKSLGIDMIITDHHQPLDDIPKPLALINPQVSPDMQFKEICGAFVAFKLCLQLCDDIDTISTKDKKEYFNDMLPYVALATVCDCMPLVWENRLIVKKWLIYMNERRADVLPSMKWFLDFLNITKIESYHMWFMIWPRLNASGRVWSAHDGLDVLLCHDVSTQKKLLEGIDGLNTDRKSTQEDMITTAKEMTDYDQKLLFAAHEDFHEGIVWIVAGRLTNEYNKPSVIIAIDHKKWIASGSLRWPGYFSVIDMLKYADDLLIRYGGHEQAGGLTVSLDSLDALKVRLHEYCLKHISDEDLIKDIQVDTRLYDHELHDDIVQDLDILWPYWEWNREPIFLLEWVKITGKKIMWRGPRTHLKLLWNKNDSPVTIIFRWKWDEADMYTIDTVNDFIWHLKEDSYSWWWFLHGLWSA